MIGRLIGTVAEIAANGILLDVHGVGYEVSCSNFTLQQLSSGEQATLIIYTVMRDSEIRLYGFITSLEKRLFEFLLQVSGVGPRSALEVLSSLEAAELIRVIGSGDVPRIQRAKGIGKKTAERIVLELKDKVSSYAVETTSLKDEIEVITQNDITEDSILALVSLGFTKSEAEGAVSKAVARGGIVLKDASALVKAALSCL